MGSWADAKFAAVLGFAAAASLVWCRRVQRGMDAALKKASSKVGVGIGVVVYKEATGEVLLGLRKNAHGENTWALPGGWLEKGEDFVTCALRELKEEVGFTDADLGPASVIEVPPSNNVFDTGVHSVSVFVKVPLVSASEPVVTEPDKCECWAWFSSRTREFPSPMFKPAHYLFLTRGFAV